MLRALIAAAGAAALLAVPPHATAQEQHDMKATTAKSLEWSPIQSTGFKPGTEIAVIHGDPAVADQPYTLRLRFPDGFRFPAHFHLKAENVTVLSGTFLLRMGATERERREAVS